MHATPRETAADQPLLRAARYTSQECAPAVATGERGRDAIARVRAMLADGTYALERVPCPCGGAQDRCVATVDRYAIPHRTVLCERCGLLRTDPRMDARATAHFYANHYRAIYERPDHDPERYFAQQLLRGQARARFVLHDVAAPRSGGRAAEIGCGAGWNLMPYRERGWECTGWDVDDAYLALGERHGLRMRRGLLEDACAAGERHHLVILSHVVEHLLDPVADLRALRGMLLPGGALYVEVPSLFAAADLARYFQNAHTWNFVPQTLERTMRAAGYRRVWMNGMIESLWRPVGDAADADAAPADARAAFPADPALVRATERFLRARERSGALAARTTALRQRAWRLRDRLRRGARLDLTERPRDAR